jgi:single-stranded DNA-binding protein
MTPCWSATIAGRVISVYASQSTTPMFRARVVVSKYMGKRAKDPSNPYEDVFIDCVAFGQDAENMQKRVEKGCIIFCYGEPQVGKAFTTKDGQTVSPQELIIERWSLLSKAAARSDNASPENSPAPAEPVAAAGGAGEESPFL